MGSSPFKDIKDQKELKELKEKEKDFKELKEKEKDFKEKEKDFKDFKELKEKDKDFKEKDQKEFKEKDFKDFKEIREGPGEQLPVEPPIRGPEGLGDMLRRIERLERQMGLGEPFISREERPAVGEGALRQPKDQEPGNS